MSDFYRNSLRWAFVRSGLDAGKSTVLAICADDFDRDTLQSAGVHTAVISNLEGTFPADACTPFEWKCADAETLPFEENRFDLVVVHAGLHHCREPQHALCEMYRVAGRAVLFIEPSDTLLTRVGAKLGIGQEYEIHSVAAHDLKKGGLRNGPVPNYVFRWTRRNVFQTIASYDPAHRPQIEIHYHFIVHWHDLRAKKNPLKKTLMLMVYPALWVLLKLIPAWRNNMAVLILKQSPGSRQNWIEEFSGELRPARAWFESRITVGKVFGR